MTLRYVRIGSMDNIHVYDDADFDSGIETDHVIKAGTAPTDAEDVVRLGDLIDLVWPIGSVFLSVVSTNPNTLLGFGTWVQIASGQFLLGEGGGYTPAESTGGSMNHTHDVDPAAFNSGSASPGISGTTDTASPITGGPTSTATAAAGSDVTLADDSHVHSVHSHSHDAGSLSVNSHSHLIDVPNTTSGNNSTIPPYFVVYVWKRTA